MSTIVRIERAGSDLRTRRVFLDDLDEPVVTSVNVVKALTIAEGDTVGRDDLVRDVELAAAECARERALRLLSSRERSRYELLTRLRDDGYADGLSTAVVDRMQELGLVDDERFAGMWARSRAAAGLGRQRILAELKQKGIDQDLATSTLDEQIGGDELERATAAISNATVPTDRKQRERLIRRLVTRGYTIGVATAAVSALGREE